MFKSVYILVMDSVGVGAQPDAYKFGDEGADTFGHVTYGEDLRKIDLLLKLGMCKFTQDGKSCSPIGAWGRMKELSAGKDTVTGHWELMGVVTKKPMPVSCSRKTGKIPKPGIHWASCTTMVTGLKKTKEKRSNGT